MLDQDIHLDVRGLGKSFGATRALDDVSVEVRSGSVHGFVGENGAGKSTLGKIIAGVFPPDQGQLVVRGTTVSFDSPRAALKRGIALVAQEVALVPQLTVAQNVYLGAEPQRRGFVDRRQLHDQTVALATEAGFDLQPEALVGRLSIAEQQQVEILRALARDAELIVLDEPSAALSAKEVDHLHAIVRTLSTRGHTVFLVSHFLNEVLELADTITVLRDGKVVQTGPAKDESESSLIGAMLGRAAGRAYPSKRPPAADAPVVLAVSDLEAHGVRGVSLEIRAGEIVGLAGLVGAGRSELARAIYGASSATATAMSAGERALEGSPSGSIRAGLALIPESRKDDGLLLQRPVRENVSLAALGSLGRFGFVRRGAERAEVGAALDKVSGTRQLEIRAAALSGGNQQKLMFARALLAQPRVLIADEPTRGVDVGAKRDLYALIVEIAATGVGVLLISNEIEEILGLAHRVVVMRLGRVAAELSGPDLTEEAILAAAFGAAPASAA